MSGGGNPQIEGNMNTSQEKITGIVEDYKTIFPDEYMAFVRQQKEVRDGLINEFASLHSESAIERKLFDTPATLHTMFVDKLNKDETLWFKTKEGGRWFAKTFKEFRASIKL